MDGWMDTKVKIYIKGLHISHPQLDIFQLEKNEEILPFVTTWLELEGILLNGMSDKDKYSINSLPCGILKNKTKMNQTHRERGQACGYYKWRVGGGELKEGSQKVQSSSCKISKHTVYNVQHDDYS